MSQSLLEVSQLCMRFPVQSDLFSKTKRWVKAVDGVSFSIASGQTLGLVGESGCGKSTVARCIVRLLEPVGGIIRLMGRDITHLPQWRLRKVRRDVQLMFQDSADALDPRMDVRHIIEEPMLVQGGESSKTRQARVLELLDRVGLPKSSLNKFPHEFSGGQRQRIGIARALSHCPKLLILDEPVSALDASVQSQALNLLMELQRELGLAYLFISHDLSVVRHVSVGIAASAQPVLPGESSGSIDPPPGSAFGHRIQHPLVKVTSTMDLTPVAIEPGHLVAPDPCALSPEDVQRLGIKLPDPVCLS